MYWLVVVFTIKLFQLSNGQNVCSKDLELLQSDQLERNIFVGCQVLNAKYTNDTATRLFDSFYCGSHDSNSTAVTVALSSESRFFKWSRLCLILSEDEDESFLLYTLTVDTAQQTGYTLYIERNLMPNLRLKRVPVYKVFPHINLRLPADFFYPFSCRASSNTLHSFILLIFVVVLQF